MKYVLDAILVCALIAIILLIADTGLTFIRRLRGKS